MITYIKKSIYSSNYPAGYWLLFSCEAISRYAFWAIQSLLVLHLINNLNFSKFRAYEFIGSYIALTYSMTFVGGLIGDKLLGYFYALFIGLFSLIVGCILILFNNKIYLLGFSFLVFGIGIVIPNITRYVGVLYDANLGLNRSRGFGTFYLASNLGGICGPLIAGFINYYYGWQYAVASIILCYSLWLICFLFFKNIQKLKAEQPIKSYKIFLSLLLLLLSVLLMLTYQFLVSNYLIILTFSAFIYVYLSCRKLDMAAMLLYILIGLLVALLFFTFEFQILSSLLIFSKDFVNTRIFGVDIPVTSLVSIEPLFVVILIPSFNRVWEKKKLLPMKKLVLSMFLLGLSYCVFLVLSIFYYYVQSPLSLLWIVIGIMFMAAGEVCLMPSLLTFISENAPLKIKSTSFGILYITISISGYLSSELAKLTSVVSSHSHKSLAFILVYFMIAAICFMVAILVYVFTKRKAESYST